LEDAMRLVTRGDLDGLTSAVFITTCERIDEILLIHPQDVTDKRVTITKDDILVNLPYHPECGKWFDHHILTDSNEKPPARYEGRFGLAPSAARLVYEYYLPRHSELYRYEALLADTDRLDSAQLTIDDVLDPKGFILLGYTLDPRTGLGAFIEYFKKVVEWLKTREIGEILEEPEVKARIVKMRASDLEFRGATYDRSRVEGNLVVTDFRGLSPIPVGNRFLVYTLFPQANISMRLHRGPTEGTVAVAVGHSIFNRTSRTNVGVLMSRYGGGGHKGAGTCLLRGDAVEAQIAQIVAAIKADG
jgi:hypothetical protein